MKERPILFSAPMVRALLAGAKTQTRRFVKLVGADSVDERSDGSPDHVFPWPYVSTWAYGDAGEPWYVCPYGVPGDRLWVRETWRLNWASGEGSEVEYRADNARHVWPVNAKDSKFLDGGEKWKPSIFLQRQFSRITLEVTSVRVERLNDISEEDAKAEGVEQRGHRWRNYEIDRESSGINSTFRTARDSYESLWESINGPDSWAANRWVWVVGFKVTR